MDIRHYLRTKGFQWSERQRPKGLTAIMNCPFCDDNEQKFGISLVDGAYSCYHENRCREKGSWWDFQKKLGDKPVSIDTDLKFHRTQKTYKKPETKPNALDDTGMKFLIDRGFNKSTVEKFKIGQKNGAIMLPTFKDNVHVGTKFRAIAEKKFWNDKGVAPYLFNRDNCSGEALAITEGHFDCMALDQYGVPAVSVPNGVSDLEWIELEWDYLEQFQRVYLFFDNDPAGQEAVNKAVNRIGQYRCYNVTLPYKDANECLIKGVTQEQIKECIKDANEYNPERLRCAEDYEADIVELVEHPENLIGIATPWRGLTDLLKGWREQELTIWSGSNFSGKSTIINTVVIDLLGKREKVLMASMEMTPKRYLHWMIKTISKQDKIKKEDVRIYLRERMSDLYIMDMLGNCDPDELINICDFASRKYGVRHFFIDSLKKIKIRGNDKYEAQEEFINRLIDEVAVKHNSHVHLVVHPRKGKADEDKPGKVDVSGASAITDLADNVLMMWRPTAEMKQKAEESMKMIPDNVLFVKKNREWGFDGKIEFSFEEGTKSFSEIQ